MINVGTFPNVGPNQKQTMGVDFGDFLPSGVTLTGTPTLSVIVSLGDDLNPQDRVVDGPDIGTISAALGGTGKTNASVLFQCAGFVPNTTYVVDIYCARSDGDIAEASVNFRCVPPS